MLMAGLLVASLILTERAWNNYTLCPADRHPDSDQTILNTLASVRAQVSV